VLRPGGQRHLEDGSFVQIRYLSIEDALRLLASASPAINSRLGRGTVDSWKFGFVAALCLASIARAAPPLSGARPAEPFLFTAMDERAAAFSPDGRTVVFALRIADYRQVLAVSERRHGRWSDPEVAPFSGLAFDGTPAFSPDSRTLYFASDRNAAGGTKSDFDIWTVRREGDRWSVPRPVRGKVNSPANETGPAVARSGRLYFSSSRSGGGDIYVAEPGPYGFAEPHLLGGTAINSDYPEGGPALNRDETIMVFASAGRPDQPLAPGNPYTRSDLYISHRTGDRWSPAKRLGAAVNTQAVEASPSFSADDRWLYFVSEHGFATDQQVLLTPRTLHRGLATARNGLGNVYVISASAIEDRR
jgi:Tol biopolymer transport system component